MDVKNKKMDDFFTAGVGQTSPTAPSLGPDDLNMNNWHQTMPSANAGQLSGFMSDNYASQPLPNVPNMPNAGMPRPLVEPARVGRAALQGYAPLVEPSQSTLPPVANFGPGNEILPNMVERDPRGRPDFGVPVENLGNVVVQSKVSPFREDKIPSGVIQTEGDRLSPGAIKAVEHLERELDRDGQVASFYDGIRGMMEENLERSFNRKVGNE